MQYMGFIIICDKHIALNAIRTIALREELLSMLWFSSSTAFKDTLDRTDVLTKC